MINECLALLLPLQLHWSSHSSFLSCHVLAYFTSSAVPWKLLDSLVGSWMACRVERPNVTTLPVTTSRMTHSTPADRDISLEDCEAVCVWFSPLNCAIVWRDRPKHVRPVERGKRIRDLQPGDRVTFKGQPRVVRKVEVYR